MSELTKEKVEIISSLFRKLKQLNAEDNIFSDGGSFAKVKEDDAKPCAMSSIATSVIHRLDELLHCKTRPYPSDVDVLIKLAEEFLNIFIAKTEKMRMKTFIAPIVRGNTGTALKMLDKDVNELGLARIHDFRDREYETESAHTMVRTVVFSNPQKS